MSNLSQYKLDFKSADVYYIPNFLSADMAEYYFKILMATILFEKKEKEGRLTALHGSAQRYKYALNEGVPVPWTSVLLTIKDGIEKLSTDDVKLQDYDVCLLNYYENGKEKFAFHSDKEEIGNDVPIGSVSLGAVRKFYFQSKVSDEKHCLWLESGSLLIMGRGTHENYVHSLPADNSVKLPRLNLTYRKTRPINNPTLIDC
jgi:alkylated DNA repair dioxygenase AlkB